MMKKIHILWVLCCLLPLSSCLDEQSGELPVYPNRTVLFYMAGDNSLSGEVQQKIDALTQGWTSPSGHLLVYADPGGAKGACLLEIRKGSDGVNQVDTLVKYGVQNSASSAAFGRAVNQMYTLYPAESYGLVIFSHGSGWLPDNGFIVPRSVVSDNEYDLDIVDFASEIPDGLFDFIVFESCLMASLEVAYELQDKTNVIVASAAEILSPGFTPLYGQMLPCLFDEKPQMEQLAQIYFDHCNAQPGENRSATISVISPKELKDAKPLIAAAESRVKNWGQIGRDYIQRFDRRKRDHLIYDAEEYMRQICTPVEYDAFIAVVERAVTYHAATPSFLPGSGGFDIQRHCGLTMYIPASEFPYLNAYRRTLKLFGQFTQE